MSAEAGAPTTVAEAEIEPDLDELARSLRSVRSELLRKIEEGRVRDEAKERIRIKRARTLAYVVDKELEVYRNREMELTREELNELAAELDVEL